MGPRPRLWARGRVDGLEAASLGSRPRLWARGRVCVLGPKPRLWAQGRVPLLRTFPLRRLCCLSLGGIRTSTNTPHLTCPITNPTFRCRGRGTGTSFETGEGSGTAEVSFRGAESLYRLNGYLDVVWGQL